MFNRHPSTLRLTFDNQRPRIALPTACRARLLVLAGLAALAGSAHADGWLSHWFDKFRDDSPTAVHTPAHQEHESYIEALDKGGAMIALTTHNPVRANAAEPSEVLDTPEETTALAAIDDSAGTPESKSSASPIAAKNPNVVVHPAEPFTDTEHYTDIDARLQRIHTLTADLAVCEDALDSDGCQRDTLSALADKTRLLTVDYQRLVRKLERAGKARADLADSLAPDAIGAQRQALQDNMQDAFTALDALHTRFEGVDFDALPPGTQKDLEALAIDWNLNQHKERYFAEREAAHGDSVAALRQDANTLQQLAETYALASLQSDQARDWYTFLMSQADMGGIDPGPLPVLPGYPGDLTLAAPRASGRASNPLQVAPPAARPASQTMTAFLNAYRDHQRTRPKARHSDTYETAR